MTEFGIIQHTIESFSSRFDRELAFSLVTATVLYADLGAKRIIENLRTNESFQSLGCQAEGVCMILIDEVAEVLELQISPDAN